MITIMKIERIKRGQSQQDIARATKIPRSIYSMIETGRLMPTDTQSKKLEEIYQKPVEKLLQRVKEA